MKNYFRKKRKFEKDISAVWLRDKAGKNRMYLRNRQII